MVKLDATNITIVVRFYNASSKIIVSGNANMYRVTTLMGQHRGNNRMY